MHTRLSSVPVTVTLSVPWCVLLDGVPAWLRPRERLCPRTRSYERHRGWYEYGYGEDSDDEEEDEVGGEIETRYSTTGHRARGDKVLVGGSYTAQAIQPSQKC